jgi:hypothetical protein
MAQEKWLLEGPKTIDIERVGRLKVALVAGQIDIIGHDEPGARVEVHSVSGRDLKVSIEGDTLEIDHPQLRWDNFLDVFTWSKGSARAEVSVMVPRAVALRFGAVSATALISGLESDLNVSTVSGDVILDGVHGDLNYTTVGGELSARDHVGKISAKTVSGDVTVSGEVTAVTTETVNGDVLLDITGVPDELRVSTVSGGVTVRLDEATPAAYTINRVGGRLQLDDHEFTRGGGRHEGKFGSLDGRWVDLRVSTVGGNVSVLHTVRA